MLKDLKFMDRLYVIMDELKTIEKTIDEAIDEIEEYRFTIESILEGNYTMKELKEIARNTLKEMDEKRIVDNDKEVAKNKLEGII
jgi:hypothetical protein